MGYKQHGSVWSRPQQWFHSDPIEGAGSGGSTSTADISWHLSQHGVDCSATQQVGSSMSLYMYMLAVLCRTDTWANFSYLATYCNNFFLIC